jgi:hypothetical protein
MTATTKPTGTKKPKGFAELLAERWRERAALMREYNPTSAEANVLHKVAAELEAEARAYALEALTLEAAAEESGYGYSSIQKQIADGLLENVGKKGNPRVRRGDLPTKGARPYRGERPGIADRILANRRDSR